MNTTAESVYDHYFALGYETKNRLICISRPLWTKHLASLKYRSPASERPFWSKPRLLWSKPRFFLKYRSLASEKPFWSKLRFP